VSLHKISKYALLRWKSFRAQAGSSKHSWSWI